MAVKLHPTKTTLSAAVSDAYSALAELRDEVREVCDNMPESLQSGERYSTLDQTANDLDFADQEPDVPENYADATVTYGQNRRRSQSRSDRRDEAVRMIEASISVVEGVVTQLQELLEDTQDDPPEDDDTRDDDLLALQQLLSDLEEAQGQAEGCEFPGMRG